MYQTFIDKIKKGEHFSFARYGDGEWNCIFGKRGSNCDGHQYFDSLGEALDRCLTSKPSYYLGMQSLAMRIHKNRIEAYCETHELHDWIDADIFHKASIKGYFNEFMDAIATKQTVLVGSFDPLLLPINPFTYIEIPERDCWQATEGLMKAFYNTENKVVLICGSMAANVWVHDLHKLYGENNTFIDMGSVFDPYVGKVTRSYHKDLEIIKGKNVIYGGSQA